MSKRRLTDEEVWEATNHWLEPIQQWRAWFRGKRIVGSKPQYIILANCMSFGEALATVAAYGLLDALHSLEWSQDADWLYERVQEHPNS